MALESKQCHEVLVPQTEEESSSTFRESHCNLSEAANFSSGNAINSSRDLQSKCQEDEQGKCVSTNVEIEKSEISSPVTQEILSEEKVWEFQLPCFECMWKLSEKSKNGNIKYKKFYSPYFDFIKPYRNASWKVCKSCQETLDADGRANSKAESQENIPSRKYTRAKRVDIFGNHFTSKDRHNFKFPCPHCKKIVAAPIFTRHLCRCMGVGSRNRTSFESYK